MISNFNEEAQEILNKAKLEMLDLRHPYVGTEHLVLSILHNNNEISNKLEKYNLTYNNFKQQIIDIIGKGTKKSEFLLFTPLLKKVIENAIIDSKENNNGEVTIEHLFSALLEEGEGIATETNDITINGGDIYIESADDGLNAGGDGGIITINNGNVFIKNALKIFFNDSEIIVIANNPTNFTTVFNTPAFQPSKPPNANRKTIIISIIKLTQIISSMIIIVQN